MAIDAKTDLAKVAFEAYREARHGEAYDGTIIPEWDTVSDPIKSAWDVAVSAVMEQMRPKEHEPTEHDNVRAALLATINLLRGCKPNSRSEIDRRYAVTITEMEKVYAYFNTWVLSEEPN